MESTPNQPPVTPPHKKDTTQLTYGIAILILTVVITGIVLLKNIWENTPVPEPVDEPTQPTQTVNVHPAAAVATTTSLTATTTSHL